MFPHMHFLKWQDADLTFHGWIGDSKEDRERFTLWLSGILQALHYPGQLQHEAERSNVVKLLDYLRNLVSKRQDKP